MTENTDWFDFPGRHSFFPPRPSFEVTFDAVAGAAKARLHAQIQATFQQLNIAGNVWKRDMRNWSHDVDWNLRRLLAMRQAGQLTHEAYTAAVEMAFRMPPRANHARVGAQRVDFVWTDDTHTAVMMKPSPNNGRFFVRQPTPQQLTYLVSIHNNAE